MNDLKFIGVEYYQQKRILVYSRGDIFLVRQEGCDFMLHEFVTLPSKQEIKQLFDKRSKYES